MHVLPIDAAHVPALYAIYREVAGPIPHCRFVPSMEHFNRSLMEPARPETRVLVAEDGGEAHGFAALVDRPAGHDGQPTTLLTALFTPDERVAELLVAEALALIEPARQIGAFPAEHGYCPVPSYNAGWDGLS